MNLRYLYVFVVVFGIVVTVREVLISRKRNEGVTPNLLLYIGIIFSSIGFYFDQVFDYGYLLYIGIITGIIFIIGSTLKGQAKDIAKRRILDDYFSLRKDDAEISSLFRPRIHAKFLERYGPKKASVYLSFLFMVFILGLMGGFILLGSYPDFSLSWIEKMFMVFWILFTIGLGALMYVGTSSRFEWVERQVDKNEN